MSKVRVCGNSTSFEGLQATIRDETRFANLKQIGSMAGCSYMTVPEEGWISKVQFTYDSNGINYFKIVNSEGVSIEKGQPKKLDDEYVAEFTKY